jgi:hypothetical protein
MKRMTQQRILGPLVSKTQEDPFFMGWVIERYAHSYNMGRKVFAAFLHCDENALDLLSLCKLPDNTSPQFETQIRQISNYVGCDNYHLIALIREVVAVHKFKEASLCDNESFLMAARDRNKEDHNNDEQEPK